ncbi:MAG: DUF7619 domain-containing protein [Flavobacteriales bacterium]
MKALLTTVLLLLLGHPLRAFNAVIVTDQKVYCTYATGKLRAMSVGGAAPFSYVWSTGDTTQIIGYVPAGTYSVTVTDALGDVATAQTTLVQQDYSSALSLYIAHDMLWCNSTGPLSWFRPSIPEPGIWGPPPYLFDGVELFPIVEFGEDSYYVPYPGEPGDLVTITFENGDGCTGSHTKEISEPVHIPSVTVDQVNGACGGSSNGTISVTFNPPGENAAYEYRLEDLNSTIVVPITQYFGLPHTTQFTGLPAGTYNLVEFWAYPSSWFTENCYEVTTITVPDMGTNCGQVHGTAYMDTDEDCVLDSEPRVPGLLLAVLPGEQYGFTDANGAYALNLLPGSYTVQHGNTMIEEHCTGAPIPFTINAGSSLTVNLANLSVVDMDARIDLSGSSARPGFSFVLDGTVQNLTPNNTGTLTVTLQFDPLLTLQSTSPTASDISGNTITWQLAALPFFGERPFQAEFLVPNDTDLLGTVLSNSAEVSTGVPEDELSNNTGSANVEVTGSYDPNDKRGITRAGQSEDLFFLAEDDFITYTVRFQNTGTDTAFTVAVRDVIDTDLDLLSLDILSASHAFTPSFGTSRELVFTFTNILLPDSATDGLGSQGFVRYRIKAKSDVMVGDVLENTARIYFDFNPPIVTNTTAHVVEIGTGVQARASVGISVYPNPVADRLTVRVASGSMRGLRIIALDGRVVLQRHVSGNEVEFAPGLPGTGAYILEATLVDGTVLRTRFTAQQ